MGRVLGRVLCRPGKLAVFDAARSRSYAKLFWLNNNRRLVFLSETEAGPIRRSAFRSLWFRNPASLRRKFISVNPAFVGLRRGKQRSLAVKSTSPRPSPQCGEGEAFVWFV
jgi:hypothetical protein